jgi:hypothetical protein
MRVKRRMMATAAIVAGVLTAGTPAMAAGTTLKAAAEATPGQRPGPVH